MTDLSEAYGNRAGAGVPRGRLLLGAGLFAVGALLVLAGIATATTDLVVGSENLTAARLYGGVLGGVGVPAVLFGVSTVLPAARRTRVAAATGAGVALLGVGTFAYAYPCRWSGSNCGAGLADLTLPTVGLYFLGVLVMLWCLFAGVATFKRRNDPGGTARVELRRADRARAEATPAAGVSRLGGIGLLGRDPDGDVSTQTNRAPDADAAGDGRPDRERSDPASLGAETDPADGRDAVLVDGADDADADAADVYCGTCSAFRYVRTDRGMVPYCDRRGEAMRGMDACEEWTPRERGR